MRRPDPAESPEPLLLVEDATKEFGGIRALHDYRLTLREGDLMGLIGPNGAGKTTAFNLISGVIAPTRGRLFFRGREITRRKPDFNAHLGITRTFQNIKLFEHLTVVDNIKVALHMHNGQGFFSTLLHLPSSVRAEQEIERQAGAIMELLEVESFRDEPAGSLSYGDQRRVEIARALAAGPALLLLDEPAAGLNSSETEEMMELISRIHEAHGITVMLVEHDMKVIMGICRRIQVLDQGTLIAEGSPEEIKANPRVIDAYLGSAG